MTFENAKNFTLTTEVSVEKVILECLNPTSPKSFFLYAGAGSGKTSTLKNSLEHVRNVHGNHIRKKGQRIAVITYTNAACNEIISRVKADPIFVISTIHSFCWTQINSFHSDIQAWLLDVIPEEISDLESKQSKGRMGTQAAIDRERGITTRLKRMEWLSQPRRFIYNPNGDNFGMASLSHSEVLKITANFIQTKPSMQEVIVNRFPFILIDESQDTNKQLIDAFFALEINNRGRFALGLFGDTMQRIYADGKPNLGQMVPEHWEKPIKTINYRSPQRLVELGNVLRASVDGHVQIPKENSETGLIRLFIAKASSENKPLLEQCAKAMMAEATFDADWRNPDAVKTLTLEHHMAASRMGFLEMFRSLDKDSRNTTGLRNGELAGVRLFSKRIAPLIKAALEKREYDVMELLRKTSPLLKKAALQNPDNLADPLAKIRAAINELTAIDFSSANPTFLDVIQCVAKHGLFEVPNSLKPFIGHLNNTLESPEEDDSADSSAASESLEAWRAFLETPYGQIEPYAAYVSEQGVFGTHQGVKGLEFDRVLVVIDDSEARGFLFNYEKLFGATTKSSNDRDNTDHGEETGIDRTRRLLYVTCTRAEKSLALVAYTNDPSKLEASVIKEGWLDASEIVHL